MKTALREKAVELRSSGASVKEIARALEVSSSTASRWCRYVALSEEQQQNLREKHRESSLEALMPWIQKNKEMKANDIAIQTSIGRNDIGNIRSRDLLLLGIGLYWGEGYKKGSQEFGFTNSDPAIINTIIKWLDVCYQIPLHDIHARITINNLYKDEVGRITAFWSEQTRIPEQAFSKPTFIYGYGKNGRDPKTYIGTLRIKVRNSTSLRRRILASIAEATDQISLNSRNTAS